MECNAMIISTTDPVTLHEIANPEAHPFVIEGHGENTLKIYFDSEETRSTYLNPNPIYDAYASTPSASNVTPITRGRH